MQRRRPGFNPWVGKFPWRRTWQPTLVFLLKKSHGQTSLASYSPCGRKESDMTERLTHTDTQTPSRFCLLPKPQGFWTSGNFAAENSLPTEILLKWRCPLCLHILFSLKQLCPKENTGYTTHAMLKLLLFYKILQKKLEQTFWPPQ